MAHIEYTHIEYTGNDVQIGECWYFRAGQQNGSINVSGAHALPLAGKKSSSSAMLRRFIGCTDILARIQFNEPKTPPREGM
jgi:hypothetical protein